MRSHDSGWFEHVLTSALRQLFLIRSPFECLQRTARQLKYRQHQLVCSRADRRSIMNTPLLWMIAADCHGPGRTRAICLKDVKHMAAARARETNLACNRRLRNQLGPRRSIQTCFRPTVPHSVDGVCSSRVSTGPCCQPTARRYAKFAAGATSSPTIGTDLTGLRRRDLHSQKWTRASQSQLGPT